MISILSWDPYIKSLNPVMEIISKLLFIKNKYILGIISMHKSVYHTYTDKAIWGEPNISKTIDVVEWNLTLLSYTLPFWTIQWIYNGMIRQNKKEHIW